MFTQVVSKQTLEMILATQRVERFLHLVQSALTSYAFWAFISKSILWLGCPRFCSPHLTGDEVI